MVRSSPASRSGAARSLTRASSSSKRGNRPSAAGLGCTPRAPRRSSRVCSWRSRRVTALLACDGVTPSVRAAPLSEPERTMVSSVRRSARRSSVASADRIDIRSSWYAAAMRISTPLWLTLFLFGCGVFAEGGGTTPSAARGGRAARLGDQCARDWGQDDASRTFTTFVDATNIFIDTANDIDRRLYTACVNLGTDLRMAQAEMEANRANTLAVCGQVR